MSVPLRKVLEDYRISQTLLRLRMLERYGSTSKVAHLARISNALRGIARLTTTQSEQIQETLKEEFGVPPSLVKQIPELVNK